MSSASAYYECGVGNRYTQTCSQWEELDPFNLCNEDSCTCLSYSYSCHNCGTGEYQPYVSSRNCLNCPAGYYNDEKARESCWECSGGEYQDERAQTGCKYCPKGYYSRENEQNSWKHVQCAPCARGRYQNTAGQNKCKACFGGRFSSQEGNTDLDDCEYCGISEYSDIGSTSCEICPSGYYGNEEGRRDCHACTPGRFNPAVYGLTFSDCEPCDKGRSSSSGDDRCTDCSTGTYNGKDGGTCVYCPKGKWSGSIGAINISTCENCPAARYLDYVGGGALASCKICQRGKYSNASAHACTACPEGYYGYSTFQLYTMVSFCGKCQAGRYNDDTGRGYIGDHTPCKLCNTGKYGDEQGLISSSGCKKCMKGRYSDVSGSTSCTNCTAGRYCNRDEATLLRNCSLCEIGRYNFQEGQKKCEFCDVGKYVDIEGSGVCKLCPPGKFNNKKQQVSENACHECPIGYYSGINSAALCKKCALQTYTDERGQVSCKECLLGKYADREGMDTCEDAIYLNILDGLDYGCDLQLTTYVPDRSTKPTNCPPLRIIEHKYNSDKLEKVYRKNGIWTDTLCTIKKGGVSVNVTTGLSNDECGDLDDTTWKDETCTKGSNVTETHEGCLDDQTHTPTRCNYLTNEYEEGLTESDCTNLLTATWENTKCKDNVYGLSESECLDLQDCSVVEGELTYTLSCIDTCTEGEIKDDKICHEGHKKDHTCPLNQAVSNCKCFGNTCNHWCLDNGECVDMIENPTSNQLEEAFKDM